MGKVMTAAAATIALASMQASAAEVKIDDLRRNKAMTQRRARCRGQLARVHQFIDRSQHEAFAAR